jgi:hypothetical protein
MSKKIVPFTLPPERARETEPAPRAEAPAEPQPAQQPPTSHGPDHWVLAAHQEAPRPFTVPLPVAGGRVVIDLTARRSWPELVLLVWSFPWLATWYWMQQTLPGWRAGTEVENATNK